MAGRVLLYLVRHGLAAERGESYPDDSVRPLTPDGVRRIKEEAQGLMALQVELEEILTSPFTRARQTAEVIARAMPQPPPVTDFPSLAVGGQPAGVLSGLQRFSKRRSLALVGHEPDIGQLAARLIGSRHAIPFKKGAVCCIQVETLPPDGPGELQWFLTPRMLRRLGSS
jgi:phosphohistidine phosphatase